MDQHKRIAHLKDLQNENDILLHQMQDHLAKLQRHHASRERDRGMLHATKAIARAEKEKRWLDRQMRNESKRSS
ncbi:MAG: hypothetical protein V4510_01965 [bacterium]